VQEQDIVDENYADTDSDEEQNDTRLQDPDDDNEDYDNNDNNEDADWRGKFPADRASVHTFVGQQNGLNEEAAPESQLSRLEVKHSTHWPGKGKERRYRCQMNKKTKKTVYFYKICDCGLCVVQCFEVWHSKTKIV
jgi:hypothetical protein